MGQNKFALARYYLIDSALKKQEYVKTQFLADFCRRRTGFPVSRRTIQLDINAMRHDPFLGFHAPIDYCHRRKAYYYTRTGFQLYPFRPSRKETEALENLLIYIKDSWNREEYEHLRQLLVRMKLLEEMQ